MRDKKGREAVKVMLSMWPHTPVKDWGDEEHNNCKLISEALTQAEQRGAEMEQKRICKLIWDEGNAVHLIKVIRAT